MKTKLDQIKWQVLHPKCQVVLFHPSGQCIDSCDTLLNIDRKISLYEQFDFLEGLQEVLPNLNLNEPLSFDWIEWKEQVKGLFQITLERTSKDVIQWLIFDKSSDEAIIRSVQQSRNEATINEEFLDIRKKYLEAEKELLSLKNEELKRLQLFKQRFFAEVSHEMRTPLNNISGLARLIQEEPHEQEYYKALLSTSKHLNHIINDVLDLVKIEENKLVPQIENFHLKRLLDNVFQGFYFTARKKSLDLEFSVQENTPNTLKGDPVRLAQILYNLLGNALKFTEQGNINLKVYRQSVNHEDVTLSFILQDTGKGMTETDQQEIMKPFVQAKGQKIGAYGGTGLGMGIVQGLLKVMEGTFKLESQLGKGTKITFTLPFKKGERTEQAEEGKEELQPMDLSAFKVLCAEDDPISAMIMKEHLAAWKLQYVFISKISEMELALKNEKFDLLISDMTLEDGQVLPYLLNWQKAVPGLAKLPVIFVSGDAKQQHPELSKIEKAFYVVKPLQPEVLRKCIQRALFKKEHKQLPVLNLMALEKAAQYDAKFVQELVKTILEVLPKDMEALEQSIAQNDSIRAAKILHKMKPSISYLGLESLANDRATLHKSVENREVVDTIFPLFKREIKSALQSLQRIANESKT